jgi:hypothetical protein
MSITTTHQAPESCNVLPARGAGSESWGPSEAIAAAEDAPSRTRHCKRYARGMASGTHASRLGRRFARGMGSRARSRRWPGSTHFLKAACERPRPARPPGNIRAVAAPALRRDQSAAGPAPARFTAAEAGRCRPGQQSRQLAMGRRLRRRCRTLFPRVQSDPAKREVRSRW